MRKLISTVKATIVGLLAFFLAFIVKILWVIVPFLFSIGLIWAGIYILGMLLIEDKDETSNPD